MQGLRSSKTLFQNGLIVPVTSKVLVPECRLVLIELVLCGFTLRDDERREGFRRDRRDRGIPGPNTGTWGTHIGERWAIRCGARPWVLPGLRGARAPMPRRPLAGRRVPGQANK